MKIDVVLVQPNYHVKEDAEIWTCNPPIGLCYLAAKLKQKKISVKIIDANVDELSINETVKIIKKYSPKIVGFSILTPVADWSKEVIKKLPEEIIKIAGGPHPSAIPEDSLKSGFDIVVIGEGEETLVEIAEGKDLKEIKGIVFTLKDKIIINKPREPLNPNKIPFPDRDLIKNGGTNKPYVSAGTRYFPWSPLVTSRGCPYNCYFCNKSIFGFKFRPRSPEDVIKEIDLLVKHYGVKEINFYDDNFNYDMKRAEKIMDLIISRKYKLYLRFSNGIRADKISKRLLKKMKTAGTNYIAYGIESGDPDILKSIPKGETLDQIKHAVQITKEVGIPVTGFFIFGLIGDTKKTMQNTLNFSNSLDFDSIILNIATPYPGTRMWDMIKKNNGKILLKKWQDFHNTSGKMLYSYPGMATATEVEKIYRKAHLSFYFRPKYILKQVPKFFSPSNLPIIYRGLKRIFYAQKTVRK